MWMIDVFMQMVCNFREREEVDWKSFFVMVDFRFKWEGVWKLSGCLWFIEVIWEG